MHNPHDFSQVDLNQSPIATPPPHRMEWGVIGIGLGVSVVWWLAQTVFWVILTRYLLASYSASIYSSSWFVLVLKVLQFASPLAYGTLVGFVVGYRARFQVYKATTITMLLAFVLTSIFTSLLLFWFYNTTPVGPTAMTAILNTMLTPQYLLQLALSFVLSFAAALNGAYLAQSFKRNRGVRIQ